MRPLTIGFIVAVAVAAGIAVAVQEWSPAGGCSREPGPGVDWSGCNRQALDLRDEGLNGMIFAGADIARSALAGADLREADLRLAFLTGAKMEGARQAGVKRAHPLALLTTARGIVTCCVIVLAVILLVAWML